LAGVDDPAVEVGRTPGRAGDTIGIMVINIDIDPNTQERLRKEAERSGVDVAEYARKLIESALPPERPATSLGELFGRWEAEDATADPAVLADRQREWEEFKRGLDAARTSNRKLVPSTEFSIQL
jgi:hypothetical protein